LLQMFIKSIILAVYDEKYFIYHFLLLLLFCNKRVDYADPRRLRGFQF
jgi:hypothetical protein